MNDNKFWELIDDSKRKSKGDPEKQIEFLVSNIAELPEQEIYEFDKIFYKYYVASYTSELWAAAYIINGGCSDDGFDYFRGWLISQGKEVYENALKEPESLAEVISEDEAGNIDFEDILYVSFDAYKLKTGKDDFYDKVQRTECPEIELTWSENEEVLEEMFPKLVKKFWQ
ncbi:DUF4240 domain-containing protein [Acetivibrio straminisolvens]|jgi:hypothetical protein|uniref:DUF4240 domain-containing protein n=1 Tax=Acetivibrio straminisolvens JCM 21531 TaxID=1294263 RepID=W4V9T0_9FIRM|nr:DUF4240 domain-containing protein [Acetivibrio straminisolvens]GAE90185.1 hypothetical protein JCM21531_3775 [Acetivibrio straminisolvens JCM 21531]